ncbi:hypothetical protein HAZT_HAZT005102 [Hyalella azteca]|uniref:protein-synthesizing GTPase n=1 Tax=Hyalella azteca TaxID=294128 RepID=A0A6A0H033_HYAAZ|nr:hypothetical protein HAZT_HAZT005102 [Hyalella azteca]
MWEQLGQLIQSSHILLNFLGHVDHGKTTLTSAITAVLAKCGQAEFTPYDKIDQAPAERARGITINTAHVGYRTEKRTYAHTDCPGHMDFIKNMIAGTAQMDAAIVIVAATDGPMPQTREHLMLAKQIGLNKVVVFVNKCEIVDKDVLELVEIEMRELLDHYGFKSDDTPFIFGSALLALKGDTESEYGEKSIHRLMQALDDHVEPPVRDLNVPFFLPVSSTVTVPNRGTVLVGTMKRGVLRKGQDAELIGYDRRQKTRITGMQVFHKDVDSCQAGENVGVIAKGIKKDMVDRGMALVPLKSMSLHNRFEATIYLLSADEGGRQKALPARYIQMLHIDTWCMSCRFDLPPKIELMMPGEQGVVHGTLLCQMPITIGMTFTVREAKSTIATGVITKLLPSVDVPKRMLVLVDFNRVVPNK